MADMAMMKVVRAIIVDAEGERVLVGLRARGAEAGKYGLIGGKPGPRESMQEAIVREVKDEIGLKFVPVFYREDIDTTSDPEQTWSVTYFTGTVTGKLKLEIAEVKRIIYVSKDDLEKIDMAFNHKQILANYFQTK